MRRYSHSEEERIHALRRVRDWADSGLLDRGQRARLEGDLHVDLRRTNPFLRAILALFTALIVVASVGLTISAFGIARDLPIAVITATAALVCIALADHLVVAFRLYRFGVEEALAVMAVVLVAGSAAALTSWLQVGVRGLPAAAALLVGAAGGVGLHRHFGFVYAALGAIICIVAVPFRFGLSTEVQRLLAAVASASVLVVIRRKRRDCQEDHTGDEYAWLQSAAFAALYVAVNLQIPRGWHGERGLFYWSTYAGILILPAAGLASAVRRKDRARLDVGLLLAFATLITNKAYLGWPRQTWDPIVLGLTLIAVAGAVRRWLANGPGGARNGFTARRLLEKDRAVLALAGRASALVAPQPDASPARPAPEDPAFRGGRSGGAGGGGSF